MLYPFVQIHRRFLLESLIAKAARIRPALLMDHVMLVQRRILRKPFRASLHLTHVRLFTGMNPNVIFKVSRRRERLPTIRVRTRVRSLSRMRPYVHFSDVGRGEALAAPLDRALERFLAWKTQ